MNPIPSSQWPADNDAVYAAVARAKRDHLLATVYDAGVAMVSRAQRMGAPAAKCKAKLLALDAYAILLTEVPDQANFPVSIIWPEIPATEL